MTRRPPAALPKSTLAAIPQENFRPNPLDRDETVLTNDLGRLLLSVRPKVEILDTRSSYEAQL